MKFILILTLFWQGPAMTVVPFQFETREACEQAGREFVAAQPAVLGSHLARYVCVTSK